MTRCTSRTAILTLVLSLALLLCGCQAGGGVLILPDVPAKDSAQGKAQLLAAMNQQYYISYDSSDPSYFIYGSDSAAEAGLAYLQDTCGDDASKVVSLLSDSTTDDTSPVRCADELLARCPALSGKPCKISYAELDSDSLEGADFASAAQMLLKHRKFLVLPDDSSKADCCQVSFAVGTIGGQAFVIAVFTS